MFDKIKNYALVIFAILALGVSFVAYTYINKYNNSEALNKAYSAQIIQNDSAYADLARQKKDTVQKLAVRITNLNADVSKKDAERGYWKALYSVTKVKLDSIEQHGTGIASSGKDSVGEYGQVDFVGNKGIASYDGWTKYYFKQETKPLWHLDLKFKEFPIYSSLYQDMDANKTWRMKSWVDEPGIKFTAYHDVDSTIFIGFKSEMAKPEVHASKYNLGFGGTLSQDVLAPGVLIKAGMNAIMFNYKIIDKSTNDPTNNWYNRIQFGYYRLLTD